MSWACHQLSGGASVDDGGPDPASQNQRIIQIGRKLSPTSCSKQGQLWSQIRLIRLSPHKVLKASEQGDYTTAWRNLFPCLTDFTVKQFFFISSIKFSCFKCCPLSLVLLPLTTVNRLAPSWQPPCGHWKACSSSWNHLFSRLNKSSSISLSSQDECSSPRPSWWSSTEHSPYYWHFSILLTPLL